MTCPLCGLADCQERWLASLLTPEVPRVAEYLSTERVYGKDDLGRTVLFYAAGDPIPEDEAVRQGLVAGKAVKEAPATKHVEGPPQSKTPAGPPRRPRRS